MATIPLPQLPKKPTAGYSMLSYPGDLIADGREYYTQIHFVKYHYTYATDGNNAEPKGGFILPLPKKINEAQTLNWEAVSATAAAAQGGLILSGMSGVSAGAGNLAARIGMAGGMVAKGILGAMAGVAPNPFLWMLFTQPNFKEHTFSWTFTPSNAKESDTIRAIIRYMKFNSLPDVKLGIAYGYPLIALIKFKPDDVFTFKLKPCAVVSVQVDYTGGGSPSFFKNGAPTVINLSVGFREIEVWTQDNYDGGGKSMFDPIDKFIDPAQADEAIRGAIGDISVPAFGTMGIAQ